MSFIAEMPLIGWAMIALFILIVVGFVILALREKGHEYGLNFFLSFQFIMLFLVATAMYLGVILPIFLVEDEPKIIVAQNFAWGAGGFLVVTVLAGILNSVKSNPLFGIMYTLAQALVSLLSGLAFLYLFISKKMEKARR